jgi:phage gpG-like protein
VISMNFDQVQREIGSSAARLLAMPKHIGKKHLLAGMRRSIKASGGLQKLRAATPPVNTRRGRRRKGEKARSTGELRRAVMTRAKWIGRNRDGVAVAGLGYKYGMASRKAIWHEFGTTRMKGIAMMQRTFESIREPVKNNLAAELAVAIEKAAAELASGMNPGMSARGRAAGL